MKKFLMIVLFLSFLGFSCKEKIDIEKEKAAIVAVIEEETNAYVARDFQKLANTYIQDETNMRLTAGKGGYEFLKGWKCISDSLKSWINPKNWKDVTNIKFEKTDYNIKVYPESAWAQFNDKSSYDYQGKHYENVEIGLRFLEKRDGQWKIVLLSIVGKSSYDAKNESDTIK